MPYINVENSGKGENKGSCRALVWYLSKENIGKPLTDIELFFSQSKEQVNQREVIKSIDSNTAKLGQCDAKFYMITVNFSQPEIHFINNSKEKVKLYVREVMELYAENFHKGLSSKDIVWFAKIEQQRTYKGFEPEVRDGMAKQGEVKPGSNTHVHVIVSRKDTTNKIKLSPMTNHRQSSSGVIKGGFDRNSFKEKSEKCFDELFNYNRGITEKYEVVNKLKNGSREERELLKQSIYKRLNITATNEESLVNKVEPKITHDCKKGVRI